MPSIVLPESQQTGRLVKALFFTMLLLSGCAGSGSNNTAGGELGDDNSSKAKVFLMAGQSNMVGHGYISELEVIDSALLDERDDVFIQAIFASNKSFGPLNADYGFSDSKFGVELKMGHVLGDTLTEDVYLFKAALGGTTLDNTKYWRPPAYGGEAGNLYEQMMQGLQRFLQTQLIDKAIDYEIAGFIWFQGFSDAVPGSAERYENHLRDLLHSLRGELGIASLPVIIVQMNDVQGVHGDTVMTAQASVANEDALNSLVPTADQRPYFHYGSRSYVVIGDRIAQAALPRLNMPSSKPNEYTVTPDMTFSVDDTHGVLANDSGTGISAQLIRTVAHGNLSLNGDGSFQYVPDINFTGQDSFEYQTRTNSDRGNSVKVTLWVREQNDPLVLHYDFDNNSPDDIIDTSSGFRARVVKEGVSFGHAGRLGNAAHFDGVGVLHYLENYPIPELLDLSTDQDFSVAMWIKVDANQAGEQTLITNKNTHNSGPGFAFTTDSTGTGLKGYLGAYSETHSTTVERAEASNAGINDGNWHHVAMSVAFSSATMTLFADGISVAQTNIADLDGDINRYESAIGGGAEGTPAFIGYMDDLRIYRKALSTEEVQALTSQ